MYALPYEYYKNDGVRRYGFHGTSHRYVSKRACDFLNVPYEKQRIITCHIGNGGSITAIDHGKSVDTSMGLTPVEGLMMGTRSGNIDPGAITFLMEKHNLSGQDIQRIINSESGVKGISGISSDMRDIEAAVKAGNERARLALDMYEYSIIKYVGAYTAVLGGVDIIVFTGGVGENQTSVRENVCKQFGFMGVKIDTAYNSTLKGKEALISTPDSKVKVVIIPTDEEYMIARDTEEIVNGIQA
jgi:acetate kinase